MSEVHGNLNTGNYPQTSSEKTGNDPHDMRREMREIPRMSQDELLRRIDERLALIKPKLSDRQLSLRATNQTNPDMMRDLRRRGKRVSAEVLQGIARALGCDPTYLLDADGADSEEGLEERPIALQQISVCGDVQGGSWRTALEWDQADWFRITVPVDDEFPPSITRFGLRVIGSSMDKVYPDGTIAIVVRLADIGRMPVTGENIVVMRRSDSDGAFEATIKEYEKAADGRHILWPRSNDPDFQTPIILTSWHDGLEVADYGDDLPLSVQAGRLHDTGIPDIVALALVVGSYRPERRRL